MDIRAASSVAAALLLLTTATAVEGQRRHGPADHHRAPTAFFGIHLVGADPVGEFGEVVDQGFGLSGEASLPVAATGALRLRADAGFVIYGHERKSVCFPVPVGCRIGVDLTTSNSIFFVGVGPELAVPSGPVQPYVNATGGFSYFATTSSLSGLDDYEGFAQTRNFDDLVGSLTFGGGLRLRLRGGHAPIDLDLGARYHRNGEAEYLREGDIVDHPDGSITIFPNRSQANLVTYRIGVSVGVGGRAGYGGDDPWDRRRRR